jgi:Xaa-Pro dipeptidase
VAEGLARTLSEMERRGVDVLVLGREGNARFVSEATCLWLAGTRPFAPGCVVVGETGAVHLMSVTDFGVPAEIPPERLYPMSWNPANIMGTVAAVPGVSGARRIGVDGLTPLFEQLFTATLPGAELTDGEAVMRAARRVKSATEIEYIQAAILVAEDALSVVVDALRPGISEYELKGLFEQRMCARSTTTPAFEGTFGVGPRRSFVSDRRIQDGDLVVLRAGVLVDGWEGSLARTWPCGEPSADHHDPWSRWNLRWQQLVDRCRPGTQVRDLRTIGPDAVVHGVGLGYEGLEDDAVLEAGMVVQLELEANRILGADMVLIGDGEPEVLTTFPTPRPGAVDAGAASNG